MSKLRLFSFELSAGVFVKMNDGSWTLTGKQLTVFAADDKIGALKQKLGFWRTHFYHCDQRFPKAKDFPDEVVVMLTKVIFG